MDAQPSTEYRVLARKYRPATFSQMIGQDALVRTLTNAIQSGRLAHAFMLTGVRGVGKTTTARIIARALNCTGADGSGGPTPEPCGVCDACVAIAADRHPDVMEMDAASRTGVDDIREIVDGVRYKPISARFKIYIIDEVHMLSKNAFNALLKTLEEPPEHTKFLFATTEIRKVPVTVLSRCQRFDLRRIEPEVLAAYFTGIAQAEGATLSGDAAELLARAADGSARDGMSLLDQAIARADGAEISASLMREMLGLADRALIADLFETVMKGDIKAALDLSDAMHRAGSEALAVVQDLLELTHEVTRLKVAAPLGTNERLAQMAQSLSVPVLARAWQMLLKGVAEVGHAPDARAALEMLLVRMAHVVDLPTPGELARQAMPESGGSAGPGAGAGRPASMSNGGGGGGASALARQLEPAPRMAAPVAQAVALPSPRSFAEVVALFAEKGEALLRVDLQNHVRLVAFEPGRIEIQPLERAPATLANRVGDLLTTWTGQRWIVSIAGSGGAATLRELADEAKRRKRAEIEANPLVHAVLTQFPGAEITAIRDLVSEAAVAEPAPDAETDGDDAPEEDAS